MLKVIRITLYLFNELRNEGFCDLILSSNINIVIALAQYLVNNWYSFSNGQLSFSASQLSTFILSWFSSELFWSQLLLRWWICWTATSYLLDGFFHLFSWIFSVASIYLQSCFCFLKESLSQFRYFLSSFEEIFLLHREILGSETKVGAYKVLWKKDRLPTYFITSVNVFRKILTHY